MPDDAVAGTGDGVSEADAAVAGDAETAKSDSKGKKKGKKARKDRAAPAEDPATPPLPRRDPGDAPPVQDPEPKP